jgi:hypothetical protein
MVMLSRKCIRRLVYQATCAVFVFIIVLIWQRAREQKRTHADQSPGWFQPYRPPPGFVTGQPSIHQIKKLPLSVKHALSVKNQTGYLFGNKDKLEFFPYETKNVDLRIMILTINRSQSLKETMDAIMEVDFMGDNVSVEVWLDRGRNNNVHFNTLKVAKQYLDIYRKFHYHVHIQKYHVGVQGQWMNVWRPRHNTAEVGLILEDDVTVSVHFWRWLKAAHRQYDRHAYISGYSLSHPKISHHKGIGLDLSRFTVNYAYKVICTTGFSPHVSSWRLYQDWFYLMEQDPTFVPNVPDILPSQWFLSEKSKGKERNLWDMWHIYFTHHHKQFTVMLNTLSSGLLAVNRHEAGLHDSDNAVGPREKLCTQWSKSFIDFPSDLPFIDYDGMPI